MDYINGCTGLDLTAEQISQLLSRMALTSQPSDSGSSVHVSVPPTRSDVLHACDVMEAWPRMFSSSELPAACRQLMPDLVQCSACVVAARHAALWSLDPRKCCCNSARAPAAACLGVHAHGHACE